MSLTSIDSSSVSASRKRAQDALIAQGAFTAPKPTSHPLGHSTRDTFTPAAATTRTGGTPTQRRLADTARRVANTMHAQGIRNRCGEGVGRAVRAATGQNVHGNGNTIGRSLTQHGFHEVHGMSLQQALNTPGLVLSWDRTATRQGRLYGHTAVTLGDGHSSASDFVERNTVASSAHRTGLHIYAPNS